MKKYITLFFLLGSLIACDKNTTPINLETEIEEIEDAVEEVIETCVVEESITDTTPAINTYPTNIEGKGKAWAIKDNEEWNASVSIIINTVNRDSFFLEMETNATNHTGGHREILDFYFLPYELKCSEVDKANYEGLFGLDYVQSSAFYMAGEDGFLAGYKPVDDLRNPNLIEITEIDEVNNKIYGRFSVSYEKTSTGSNPDFEEEFRLFNGEFEVAIE